MNRANARQALQHAASAAWLAANICRTDKDDPDLQAAADAAIELAAELDALADGLPDLAMLSDAAPTPKADEQSDTLTNDSYKFADGMNAQARSLWASEQGGNLMKKMLSGESLDEQAIEMLQKLERAHPPSRR